MVLWCEPVMSILSIPFGVRQKTIVSFPCDIWFSIKFLMYLEFVFIFCISVQVNYNNQWRTKFYLSPAPFYSFIIGESPISARHWRYMPSPIIQRCRWRHWGKDWRPSWGVPVPRQYAPPEEFADLGLNRSEIDPTMWWLGITTTVVCT